jgi:glycosyltransferase involved in cell wall biosynthesis
MRIVHLVLGGELGGGQAVALRLARAARDRGDDVAFVAPGPGRLVELARADGMPVHLLELGRTYQVGKALRLGRLLRREGADVLHTHTLASANTLGRITARLAGVAVISHLHIENHFRPATRPLLRTLDNATARLCAGLIAVSEDTRRAYVRQGYPKHRIEVVLNGVELDAAAAAPDLRSELGFPPDVPLVGEVARLCDVKGQRELIQAIASVPEARLVLVGADLERDGAFEAELRREAELQGVGERVAFAGRRDDVAGLLDQLDVVALPSWTEGLPLVVLEAMARGRAVVATPVGGTAEAVTDEETGLLVPPREPKALAGAISRLLADPDLRARMGDAGRRRVAERFSADAMCRRVLELYDEVVAP